jgi:hypothetical protein
VIRKILALFGLRVVYVSDWGSHSHRYDSIDRHMGRPIHKQMSVAPPWARLRIERAKAIGAREKK